MWTKLKTFYKESKFWVKILLIGLALAALAFLFHVFKIPIKGLFSGLRKTLTKSRDKRAKDRQNATLIDSDREVVEYKHGTGGKPVPVEPGEKPGYQSFGEGALDMMDGFLEQWEK